MFPLFFFWLAIPLPSFQQATTHLQLLATSMAHHGAALFGVETIVQGNDDLRRSTAIGSRWKSPPAAAASAR